MFLSAKRLVTPGIRCPAYWFFLATHSAVFVTLVFFLIVSFLTLFCNRILSMDLSIFLWTTLSFSIKPSVNVHVSAAYVKVGKIHWLNTCVFRCWGKSDLNTCLRFPYAAHPSPILLRTSSCCQFFVNDIFCPRYTRCCI